ncbi:hypothetical protein BH09PAT1_BH09PAT1_1390 [soil metagenome]
MFRTEQEFTFSIKSADKESTDFIGRLIFESELLNSIGTTHTEEELASFGVLLNESLSVPEYWTLETLAEHLFSHAKPIFNSLVAVSLYIAANHQRVSEYRNTSYSKPDTEADILELEAIA